MIINTDVKHIAWLILYINQSLTMPLIVKPISANLTKDYDLIGRSVTVFI